MKSHRDEQLGIESTSIKSTLDPIIILPGHPFDLYHFLKFVLLLKAFGLA